MYRLKTYLAETDLIPIQFITEDGIVVNSEYEYMKIFNIAPKNLALLSHREQEALASRFMSVLNAIHDAKRVRFFTMITKLNPESVRMDFEERIRREKQRIENKKNLKILEYLKEQGTFWMEVAKLLRKTENYLTVVYPNPTPIKKRSYKTLEDATIWFQSKEIVIINEFKKIDVNVKPLTGVEVADLLWRIYHPSTSQFSNSPYYGKKRLNLPVMTIGDKRDKRIIKNIENIGV